MKGRVETLGILSLIFMVCFSSLSFATTTGQTPANNSWTSNASIATSFSYNRTASINGTVTCELYVDAGNTGTYYLADTQANCLNDTTYATPSSITLVEGTNKWKVRSYNSTTSENSSEMTLYVDRTAPTIVVNTIEDATFNTSTASFNITATDSVGSINCTFYAFGIANNISMALVSGTPYVAKKYGVAEGFWNWSVICGNNASLTSTSGDYNFSYDAAPPQTVTWVSPATNTWDTDGTITVTINQTDLISPQATCSLVVGGVVKNSTIVYNNTQNTSIVYISQGNNSAYISCVDSAGGSTNISTTIYVPVDTANPLVSMSGSGSPANGTIASATTYNFNWTYTDGMDGSIGCNLTLNDTFIYNITTTNNSYANKTLASLSPGNNTWYVNCTDDSGRVGQSGTRWFYVDSSAPSVTFAVVNSTGSVNMSGYINATVTDAATNIDTCYYTIYQPNGSQTNKTATISGSGTTKYCYISFTPSDFYGEGQIDFQVTANDTLGNQVQSNSSNWTINYLYTGWNMIQADRNGVLGSYNYTGVVSQISYYNNTAQNFTTWVKGLSTNENETFLDGDVLFIYVTEPSYFIRNWEVDANDTISYKFMGNGTNTMSHFNLSYMTAYQLCNEPLDNSTYATTKYVTSINASGTYIPYRCGFQLYNATQIPRGKGYFIDINATSYIGRTRV